MYILAKDNTLNTYRPLETDRGSVNLRNEFARQRANEIRPKFASMSMPNADTTRIIAHNIQSLRTHLDQVANDPVYTAASTLLFAETWTAHNSNEAFHMPEFNLVAQSDNPQSTTPSAIGAYCYVNHRVSRNNMTTDAASFMNGNRSVRVALVRIDSNVFASVYMSPNAPIALIMESLCFIVEHPHNQVVIAGELNADFSPASRDEANKTSTNKQLSETKNPAKQRHNPRNVTSPARTAN